MNRHKEAIRGASDGSALLMPTHLGEWSREAPYEGLNKWMVACARVYRADELALIALWDGDQARRGG